MSMTDSSRAVRISAEAQSLLSKHYDFVVRALTDADLKILRYDDDLAIERIKLKLEVIRRRDRWSEQDLMAECFVRSMRTPCEQRMVFTNTFFIGDLRILNTTRNAPCHQLVWYVRMLRIDGATLQTTWPCLLEITPRRFYAKDWGEPEDAFSGECLLVADADRRIVGVVPLLEERI